MSITVLPVTTKPQLHDFVRLPWRVYRADGNWVPPLMSEIAEAVGPLGPARSVPRKRDTLPPTRQAFVAYRDGAAAGRVLAAFDRTLNQKKGVRAGHFSLFECEQDAGVATALFESSLGWLRDWGIHRVRGPVCPAGPALDEQKGLLVDGFEHRPVVLTSYNPPYYRDLVEAAGFEKEADVLAYRLEAGDLFARNPARIVEYAARRYGFRVDGINVKDLEGEARAIKQVLDLAVPAEWADMTPPTLDEVRAMAKRLVPLVDADLTAIVRAGDEPVGFGLAIPDYNEVLARLDGRIGPVGALKYLWYKRRIRCARIFIMFVVPAFRQKGVAHAIYYRIFERGTAKGYRHGEASTIGETNRQMRADIEKMGGVRYKTYRIYAREI